MSFILGNGFPAVVEVEALETVGGLLDFGHRTSLMVGMVGGRCGLVEVGGWEAVTLWDRFLGMKISFVGFFEPSIISKWARTNQRLDMRDGSDQIEEGNSQSHKREGECGDHIYRQVRTF